MNTLPTVNVIARIRDQQGKPIQHAVVTMKLTTVERHAGYVVPREVRGETDINGKAVLSVWPNALGSESSEYSVTIRYPDSASVSSCDVRHRDSGRTIKALVTVPNTDCDLHDIMELPIYEPRGSGQVITEEVAGYASQAASAKDAAQSVLQASKAVETRIDATAIAVAASELAASEYAANAEASADEANAAATKATAVAGAFEEVVVARVTETANILTNAAEQRVNGAKTTALESIDQRTEEALAEIDDSTAALKLDAVNAVARGKDAAIDELNARATQIIDEFNEDAELFREDFEDLTERAETAAKRAGCSAASAAEMAIKACECADRAERAWADIDQALVDKAAELLIPEVITAASELATEKAQAAAAIAVASAESASADAATATQAATDSDANADRAEAALADTLSAADRVLTEHQLGVSMIAQAAEMIRLANRVTRLNLGCMHAPA